MESAFTLQEVKVTYTRPPLSKMTKVRSSNDVERVLRKHIDPSQLDYKEFFWIMLMSNSFHVLGIAKISEGTTTATQVNVKEVFQILLKTNAVSFILVHNHPSGNLTPSEADLTLTRRIKVLAELMDVKLLDHVILSSEGYYSFADEGTL